MNIIIFYSIPTLYNIFALIERVYHTVTFGCPAEHSAGFKNGGLKKLLQEARSRLVWLSIVKSCIEMFTSPSFFNSSEGSKASTIKQALGWYILCSESSEIVYYFSNTILVFVYICAIELANIKTLLY